MLQTTKTGATCGEERFASAAPYPVPRNLRHYRSEASGCSIALVSGGFMYGCSGS
jgi:hypothetical protein